MASKGNPEIPAYPMVLSAPGTLTHNTPWVQEALSQYGIGTEVEVKIMQRRSLPQLQLYWVVLHDCVSNSDNKYGRAEDLHDALKIALGYSRKVKIIGNSESKKMVETLLNILRGVRRVTAKVLGKDHAIVKSIDTAGTLVKQLSELIGETIVLPGSIAFGRMTQADFKVYFDRAMNELRAAGYAIDAFLEEGEKKLARMRANPYQPGVKTHGRSEASQSRDRDQEADAEAKAAA